MSRIHFFVRLALMEIRFLGHSCFQIKGKKAIVVTDPYDHSLGLKIPKVSADVVTVSHQHYDHNNVSAVSGTVRKKEPFVVTGPGEYEIEGVSIFGYPSLHGALKGTKKEPNTIYVVEMDGLRLAHLGDLGEMLDDKQIEGINGVDLLFIPVGGTYTLNANQAVDVVNKIQPKIVVPMHYQLPKLNFKLAPVDDFLKASGEEGIKPVKNLVVAYDKLPEERITVVFDAGS